MIIEEHLRHNNNHQDEWSVLPELKASWVILTSTLRLWNPVTKRMKDYLTVRVAIFNNPNVQSPSVELYSLKLKKTHGER
ncbi:hypothetical protein RHGRI_022554 [Rhododendron griersonianum]|uniref:Uncharacterized protein n=1 Tax=Rhododendron griersonianum TaxID=479676 RepID=A0AAV6J6W2_9ERIC|nr:hypothetical protein RHGRI_022554 [Rhododendron griersonianum]